MKLRKQFCLKFIDSCQSVCQVMQCVIIFLNLLIADSEETMKITKNE